MPSNLDQFYGILNHVHVGLGAFEYICFWPQNWVPYKSNLRLDFWKLGLPEVQCAHTHTRNQGFRQPAVVAVIITASFESPRPEKKILKVFFGFF